MNILKKVKRALKKVKDPKVRERLLMVKESCKKPLRDVAEVFNVTHGKVDYWKKRFEAEGVNGLKTKSKSGRPRKITEEQETQIKQTVSKHDLKQGWRTKRVRQLIVKQAGVAYCERQTIRILQRWGLAKIKPRKRYVHSKESERKEFLKKTKIILGQ